MHEPTDDRVLSSIDQLLVGLNNAFATIARPKQRATRANPAGDLPEATLSSREKFRSASLMRVNHAGEVAAQGLYQGHAAVSRDHTIGGQMRQAAAEELDHLGWCEQRLDELDSRTSFLGPLWYAGAFTIGAASAALGDRWALGFVEETERQVSEHLSGHLKKLPSADGRSRAIVRQMRDEEEQHGANANAAGAATLPEPVKGLMRLTAKVMTRAAYWI